jgi:thiamine-monophosphate kinase
VADYLRRAHLQPRPQVELGRGLLRAGIRCAIDISDGLARDLRHICEDSRLGAVVHVERLPVSDQLRRTFPDEAVEMAVSGGEDYELLFMGPVELIDRVRARFVQPITVIGEMVEDGEGRVRFLDDAGHEMTFESAGWDHFAGEGRP